MKSLKNLLDKTNINKSPDRIGQPIFEGKIIIGEKFKVDLEKGPANHSSRPLGNWQSDNAWDLFAPAGTAVNSYTIGKVKKIYNTNKRSGKVYGTQVTVTGEENYPNIFYTHLKNVELKVGDQVELGDYIGEICEWDDWPTGTHVHIGLDNGAHLKTLLLNSDKIFTGITSVAVMEPEQSQLPRRKDQIKNVQTVLKAAGYNLGEFGPNKDGIDGYLGSKTKTALKDWKSKNEMPPDDILDNNTYEAIIKKSNINGDSNTDVDAKNSKKPIEKLIKAVLPKLFSGKEVKLDNFNISKDPNFEIKKAIVEGLYCFKSLNELLNEQVNFSDLKSKLRSIKKSFDTGTRDAYRGSVNNSPIENPSVLDPVTGTDNILKVSPEVLFIYDKQNDKFYIKAANSQAIDLIGSDKEVEVNREQLGTIANSFEISKEVETPQPVTNNPTLEGHPVVPTSNSDKAQKGATIAKKLVADLGLTKEQAAGVVGNLWAESGLVPDRIQGSGMKRGILPQAGNGGYGWAQYTHHSLKTDLINFTKGKGVDLNTQPLTDELNYEYLKHWIAKNSNKLNALKSTKGVRNATDYFLKQYEKPADQSEVALSKREGFANTVYSQMA
jgi:peptidoglycan hydrolase-like protein with peptidoglycan-binding domain